MYSTNQSLQSSNIVPRASTKTLQNQTKQNYVSKTYHPEPDLPRYTIVYSKIIRHSFRYHVQYHFKTNLIHTAKAERLSQRPTPEARQPSKSSWILLGMRQSQRHRHGRVILRTRDHGNVLLLKAPGKHLYILTQRQHLVLLGMKLSLKLLKAHGVVEKGWWHELTPMLLLLLLLLLKRPSNRLVGKKPLERNLPCSAYIRVPPQVRHVTDRSNPWVLARSSRGREIRGIVEVGFGLW
jgi:hypothetical protein